MCSPPGTTPTPSIPRTTIRWNLPARGKLSVQVYDLRGRLVRKLLDEQTAAGPGQVQWDGRGPDGRIQAAGAYFYQVKSDQGTLVGKMMLLK
jgi:flagellar hook assembly protein FlgD